MRDKYATQLKKITALKVLNYTMWERARDIQCSCDKNDDNHLADSMAQYGQNG